jgi:hypothetical protein
MNQHCYQETRTVLSEFSETGAILISNIKDPVQRAEAIRWFCEAMHIIATGLGGRPEHPDWSAEQTIESHVEYMTSYIDDIIGMNRILEKMLKARNN